MNNEMFHDQIIQDIVKEQGQVVEAIYSYLNGMPVTAASISAALQNFLPAYSKEQLAEICEQLYQGVQEGVAHYHSVERDMLDGNASPAGYLDHILEQMPEEKRRNFLCTLYQVMCDLHHKLINVDTTLKLDQISFEELLKRCRQLLECETQMQGARIVTDLNDSLKHADRKNLESCEEYGYGEDEAAWISAAAMYAASVREMNKGIIETEVSFAEARAIGQQAGFMSRCAKPFRRAMMGYVVPALVSVISIMACAAVIFTSFSLMNVAMDALLVLEGPLFIVGLLGSIAVGYIQSLIALASFAIPVYGITEALEMHYNAVNEEAEEKQAAFFDLDQTENVIEQTSSMTDNETEAEVLLDPFGIADVTSPVQV